MDKLKHKELSDYLRRQHNNVFNYYETPTWIEMIEDDNDVAGVMGGVDNMIEQYQELLSELEKHLEAA